MRQKEDQEELKQLAPSSSEFQIKQNKFLLPYLMKNDIHESGMDRAKSLASNIQYNKQVNDTNPFFNKTAETIPETNYKSEDLMQMGCQIMKDKS